MANPEWTEPSDFNPRPRAELGIDGDSAFALVGLDLQVGEAEFEKIEGYSGGPLNSVTYRNAKAAIDRAYQRLKDRLDYPISYYIGDSHPDNR